MPRKNRHANGQWTVYEILKIEGMTKSGAYFGTVRFSKPFNQSIKPGGSFWLIPSPRSRSTCPIRQRPSRARAQRSKRVAGIMAAHSASTLRAQARKTANRTRLFRRKGSAPPGAILFRCFLPASTVYCLLPEAGEGLFGFLADARVGVLAEGLEGRRHRLDLGVHARQAVDGAGADGGADLARGER